MLSKHIKQNKPRCINYCRKFIVGYGSEHRNGICFRMAPPLRFCSDYRIQWLSAAGISILLTIFNNVRPLPCSHPACCKFCIHLEFILEIVCKAEKVRSTFSTFHDYLNFCGKGKEHRLFTIYI